MKELLAFISPQTPPPTSSEGLPYWIFWFLICIIILMLFFIFLRDKNLRRRINLFLFGAKQKLIKLRLQLRLKREQKKKNEIFRELGQKAWQESIDVMDSDRITSKLTRLDSEEKTLIKDLIAAESKIIELNDAFKATEQDFKKKISQQEDLMKPKQNQLQEFEEKHAKLIYDSHVQKKELKTIEKGIKNVEKEIQQLRKDHKISEEDKKKQKEDHEKRIKELTTNQEQCLSRTDIIKNDMKKNSRELKRLKEEIQGLEKIIQSIQEEEKAKKHDFRKEIKEWETTRNSKQEKVREIKRNREPLYENLGKLLNKNRIKDKEVEIFYNRIDRCNKRIESLDSQIKELE